MCAGRSFRGAVILQRLSKSTVIRGLVFLPFLISSVVAALVWVEPQFQAYFTNRAGNSIFATMQAQVKTLLSQQS
jgi:ABC-type sugar transport system permease subunit